MGTIDSKICEYPKCNKFVKQGTNSCIIHKCDIASCIEPKFESYDISSNYKYCSYHIDIFENRKLRNL